MRSPGFFVIAILTIAIGVGANAAATLLAVIAVAASLIPALRASRVDPLVALREE